MDITKLAMIKTMVGGGSGGGGEAGIMIVNATEDESGQVTADKTISEIYEAACQNPVIIKIPFAITVNNTSITGTKLYTLAKATEVLPNDGTTAPLKAVYFGSLKYDDKEKKEFYSVEGLGGEGGDNWNFMHDE